MNPVHFFLQRHEKQANGRPQNCLRQESISVLRIGQERRRLEATAKNKSEEQTRRELFGKSGEPFQAGDTDKESIWTKIWF